MTMILRTYVSNKTACQHARKYLADRSILSKWETGKRAHHKFTMWVPALSTEQQARKTLAAALGDVEYEPPVYEADPSPPAGAFRPDQKPFNPEAADHHDERVDLDEMVQRIGRALGENMGMRFNVGGNGATITVTDRWADSPDYRFTIEAVVK